MKLAHIIPWHLIEEDYRSNFATSGMGAPAKQSRIALGALIIKERLGVTDEETVDQIRENPYLQYFLGLHEYLREDLFDPSMMVHFRKRISPQALEKVNIAMVRKARQQDDSSDAPPSSPPKKTPPTSDSSDAQPAAEPAAAPNGKLTIDALHATMPGKPKKPRAYRKKARRDFLHVALSKKPKSSKIRSAIGKQLRYLKRNLGHIHRLLDNGASLGALSAYWHKCLMVIHADKIYQTRANRSWCKDRGIRLSGKPLGRPREMTREEKRQQR